MQQPECPLSKRQLSIIRLLSLGMTVKEIAFETATTATTIYDNLKDVRRACRAIAGRRVTIMGAVIMAIRNGWID